MLMSWCCHSILAKGQKYPVKNLRINSSNTFDHKQSAVSALKILYGSLCAKRRGDNTVCTMNSRAEMIQKKKNWKIVVCERIAVLNASTNNLSWVILLAVSLNMIYLSPLQHDNGTVCVFGLIVGPTSWIVRSMPYQGTVYWPQKRRFNAEWYHWKESTIQQHYALYASTHTQRIYSYCNYEYRHNTSLRFLHHCYTILLLRCRAVSWKSKIKQCTWATFYEISFSCNYTFFACLISFPAF